MYYYLWKVLCGGLTPLPHSLHIQHYCTVYEGKYSIVVLFD